MYKIHHFKGQIMQLPQPLNYLNVFRDNILVLQESYLFRNLSLTEQSKV